MINRTVSVNQQSNTQILCPSFVVQLFCRVPAWTMVPRAAVDNDATCWRGQWCHVLAWTMVPRAAVCKNRSDIENTR